VVLSPVEVRLIRTECHKVCTIIARAAQKKNCPGNFSFRKMRQVLLQIPAVIFEEELQQKDLQSSHKKEL
jgi:hypothetical protein